ncbi:MAG TPA: hypothetical protein PLW68_16310, partial [Casimicrobiaceae bacterium]|nr:hypothetical protein [Casimicrobiaceae bacterium]
MRRLVSVFCLALAPFAPVAAATLVPDASFGAGGSISFNLQGLTPFWRFAKVLPNGKILVAGKSCEFASCPKFTFTIARLNADGSLDRTFRPGDSMPGTLRHYGYEVGWSKFEIAGMDLDSQGRIVVAGRNAATPAAGDLIVVRLQSDGSRDSTFASGSAEPGVYRRTLAAQGSVQGMAIDAQDRVVVVGHIFDSGGKSLPYATRVNVSGTTDFTFNLGGTVPGLWTPPASFDGGLASSVTHDANGRIVVAGMAGASLPASTTLQFKYLRGATYNGYPFVVRLLGDGTPDGAFGNGGIATLPGFNDIASRYLANRVLLGIDSTGRILIGGETQFGGKRGLAVFRLLATGIEDATAWSYSPSWPVGGRNTPVTPMGTLGTTFVAVGGMKVDGSDNVYISGLVAAQEASLNDIRPVVFRVDGTTQPDAQFAPSLGGTPPTVGIRSFDISVSALQVFTADPTDGIPDGISLALDSSGHPVVPAPGQLPHADGPVLRVTPTGSLDASFANGGVAFTGGTGNANYPYLGHHATVLASDGRPILGQTILRDAYQGTFGMLGLVRLTPSGQIDETVNASGRPPGLVTYWPDYDQSKFLHFGSDLFHGMLRDVDDKLVVVSIARSGTFNAPMVSRFHLDGSIDTTFNAGGIYPGTVVQPIGTLNSVGFQVAQDSAKRYYVVGYAVTGGKTVAFVFRLNNNGTLDPTFSDGANPFVILRFGTVAQSDCSYGYAVSVTPGNKLLVAGMDCEAGTSTTAGMGVARLNFDGSLDASFNAAGLLPGALMVPKPPDVFDPSTGSFQAQLVSEVFQVEETAAGAVLVIARYGPTGSGQLPLVGAGIARLTSGGQLDLGYGDHGYFRCSDCMQNVRWAQLAKDGSGGFYAVTTGLMASVVPPVSPKAPVVLHLDAEGVADSSFGTGGVYAITTGGSYEVHRAQVDPIGRMVLAGWHRSTPSADAETWLARYSLTASSSPILQSASSRKVHGTAGTFDLALSLL